MIRLIASLLLIPSIAFCDVVRPVVGPPVKLQDRGVGVNKWDNQYRWAYHLYLDPARGLRDLVSRDALTTTIPAARTLDGVTFAVNTPAIVDGRLRGVPVVQNLIASPNDMTGAGWSSSQTPTITATTFLADAPSESWRFIIPTTEGAKYTISAVLSIPSGARETGFALYHYNSATSNSTAIPLISSTPTKYSVTVLGRAGGGSVSFGIYDTNSSGWVILTATNWQVTASAYPLPLNVSGSATVTEAGTSTLALTDGMSEGLGEAASGTLVTEWTPKFAAANVSADCAIITSGNLSLRYDGPNTRFELGDGTNTATVAYTAVSGAAVWIRAKWDAANSRMKLGVSTTETGEVTWGADATFAGTFAPDTATMLGGSEYQLLGKTYILKDLDW